MSGQAVTWVVEHSPQHGGAFTVLLVMASHARPDGTNIRIGMAALAVEAKLSERQVRRIARDLEAGGELRCCQNPGRGNTNVYSIAGMVNTDILMSPNGHVDNPVDNSIKGDTAVSPNGNGSHPEKGTFRALKGDISDVKGDILIVKGDIHAQAGINPVNPKKPKEPRKPAQPRERAREPTRIPSDFEISDANYEWARGGGLTDNDIHAATLEFCDYWRGVPGVKGKKLDWNGTWRNSIRRWATLHRKTLREVAPW